MDSSSRTFSSEQHAAPGFRWSLGAEPDLFRLAAQMDDECVLQPSRGGTSTEGSCGSRSLVLLQEPEAPLLRASDGPVSSAVHLPPSSHEEHMSVCCIFWLSGDTMSEPVLTAGQNPAD